MYPTCGFTLLEHATHHTLQTKLLQRKKKQLLPFNVIVQINLFTDLSVFVKENVYSNYPEFCSCVF